MIEELEKVRALIELYEQAQRLSAEIETFRSRAATAQALAAAVEAEVLIRDGDMVLLKLEIGRPSGLFAWRREAKAAALRRRLAEAEGEAARLAEQALSARAEEQLCLKEIPAAEPALAEVRARMVGVPDLADLRACEQVLSRGESAASKSRAPS